MLLFNGRLHAKQLEKQIKEYVSGATDIKTLGIFQIGDDPGSNKYINIKRKICERVGVPFVIKKLPIDVSYEMAESKIKSLCDNENIGSVLIQLPLPSERFQKLLDVIPKNKDVDGLSKQVRDCYKTSDCSFVPPAVRAVDYFLQVNKITLKGSKITLVGYGFLIGQALEAFFVKGGSEVQKLDITDDVRSMTLDADLIVLGTGVASLIKGTQIKPGAHVIDFGYAELDGKPVGDLDMTSELGHLGVVSPSPGGMGPLVVRFLLMNHLGVELEELPLLDGESAKL